MKKNKLKQKVQEHKVFLEDIEDEIYTMIEDLKFNKLRKLFFVVKPILSKGFINLAMRHAVDCLSSRKSMRIIDILAFHGAVVKELEISDAFGDTSFRDFKFLLSYSDKGDKLENLLKSIVEYGSKKYFKEFLIQRPNTVLDNSLLELAEKNNTKKFVKFLKKEMKDR